MLILGIVAQLIYFVHNYIKIHVALLTSPKIIFQ